MSMLDSILHPGAPFKTFSIAHAITLMTCALIGATIIYIGKRVSNKNSDRIVQSLSLLLSLSVIIYSLIGIMQGEFNPARDMPFAICNFSAYIAPVLVFSRSDKVFNVFYYWIMFATIQAMITPDLHYTFPYFVFIKFWFVHAGLVTTILYLIIVKGYRPTYRGLWISMITFEVFIIFLIGFNTLFNTNHMYLCHKPPVASAIDHMGPWPIYVIVGHFIILLGFHLVYLPFIRLRR